MSSFVVRAFILAVACLCSSLVAAQAGAATIVFDKAHGERFLMERSGPLDLSELEKTLRSHGLTVTYGEGRLTDDSLAGVDGLIISGPFAPIAPEEAEAVARFIQRGGRLAVMLHIGTPVTDLIHRLGVDVSNAVIHERTDIIGEQSVNFWVRKLYPHPVMEGVKQFGLYGGWALVNTGPSVEIIAATSADAWVDLDGDRKLSPPDAVGSFGVAVSGKIGSGEFLVFGDDAVFQNKFLVDGNHRLAENIGRWLGGTRP